MNTSTSSFTKDIFTRLKQINNDVKLLKNTQTDLVNSRIDEIENRLTRIETIIENKFDLLFDKLNNNITTTQETVNNDLLSKLDSIDNINLDISDKKNYSIKHSSYTDNNMENNIENDNMIDNSMMDNIDEIDINTYLGSNDNIDNIIDSLSLNNNSKKIENSITALDEILILD